MRVKYKNIKNHAFMNLSFKSEYLFRSFDRRKMKITKKTIPKIHIAYIIPVIFLNISSYMHSDFDSEMSINNP